MNAFTSKKPIIDTKKLQREHLASQAGTKRVNHGGAFGLARLEDRPMAAQMMKGKKK